MIHLHFQMFNATTVLAYALAFVAIVLAVETMLPQPIKARARVWRLP